MPSAREVRAKFETLIDGQSRLIETLQSEQEQTLRAANEERTPVLAAVKKLAAARITGPDGELGKFSAPKTDAHAALDPAKMWADLNADSIAAGKEYAGVREHDLGRDMKTAIDDRNKAQATADNADSKRKGLLKVVQPIIEANEKLKAAGKPEIGKNTSTEYASGQYWRYLTDPDFRQARSAIAKYEKLAKGYHFRPDHTGNPFDDVASYQGAVKAKAAATTKAEGFQNEINAIGLRERMLDEGQIAERVRKAVVERAVDADYVDQLARNFPKARVAETLPNAVKAKALEAVATDLGSQISTAETTKAQLEKPMSKLRRAGGRSVRVDADDIAYKVTGQNAMARMRASNAASVRDSVRSHQFTDTSSATNMYLLMTVAILASSDNDSYFSAKQLEASTDALDQAGLNLDDLTPDVSNIDVALTDTGIDIAEFDLKGVDVGDFHVDVGGIDSGIGSIDSGLSSIDVGGGMSMGGGFDSGGF